MTYLKYQLGRKTTRGSEMGVKAVILGSGLIGQQFARLLADHPTFDLQAVVASERSRGQVLADKWQLPNFSIPPSLTDLPVQTLEDVGLDAFDVVFSALPATQARDIEKRMAASGKKVFSNASAWRYDPKVPILIPEVNRNHLEVVRGQETYPRGGFVVTNSNCTVSGLAIFLHRLRELDYPPTKVFVSSYQALSGAGFEGLAKIPRDRVIPNIQQEEEKMTKEGQKILGSVRDGEIRPDTLQILANCARVPVIDGHLEALTVELARSADADDLYQTLGSEKSSLLALPTAPEFPIYVTQEEDRPQTFHDLYVGEKERAKGMVVVVGRIRTDGPYLRVFLLVHNTIRGGAGGSVLNAELAQLEGYL